MSRIAERLRGRRERPWPWPAWATAVLAVYTPLAIGFWAFFLYRLGPEEYQFFSGSQGGFYIKVGQALERRTE